MLALMTWLAPVHASQAAPRLLVVLVVDQMRADYVDWYGKNWRAGLARLFKQGADFRNAAYPYLNTVTCAGHATIGTGAYPKTHGMVLNGWYDRRSGKVTSCTDDATQPLVAYGTPSLGGGDSAAKLEVPSLADELRVQLSPSPRVVTLSMKARSAIMLAGHAATSATWVGSGGFTTSKAFTAAPVVAVTQALAKIPLRLSGLPVWTPLLGAKAYAHVDDAAEEAPPRGWSRTFPHPLQGEGDVESMANWARSPWADEHLAQVGLELVKTLSLGKGQSVDYLGLSFSILDIVGHAYGPRSHEVQDVLARLDVTIGRLLAGLDRLVGRNNYVVALTADHGVAPFPEQMSALGLPAGRVPMDRVKVELEAAIAKELGGQNHVAQILYTDIYLNPGVYEKLLAKPGAIERTKAALVALPGVVDVFHAGQLSEVPAAEGHLRAAALSYFPGRSGDIILVPGPHWMTVSSGTTHGTSNEYDQRVPLVLAGPGIKAKRHFRRVSPADLAPTLGHMVGVTLPSADGKPLTEVLSP
jgi:hypothetical protein